MTKNKFFTFASFSIIILTVLVVFGEATKLGYTWLDDNYLIGNESYFTKDIRNIPQAFLQDAFISSGKRSYLYRPLLTISFIVDTRYCRQNASCFHISNLIIHIIFCLILYLFLQKTGVLKWPAFLMTLLFSVHPLITPAIAWIPGRNDSLLAIFFLLSFFFSLKLEQDTKKRYLIPHIIFFNLALYTKETAFFLPFLIVLYQLIIKGKHLFKKPLTAFYPAWIISYLVWLGLRGYAIRNATYFSFKNISTENLPGILVYLGKIIPIKLSVLPILKDSNVSLGILISLFFLIVLYVFRKKFRDILYGYIWYFVLIIPSVINPKNTINFLLEHRSYLPLIGIMMFLGKIFPTKGKYFKLMNLLTILIVLFFSYTTFKRIDFYQSPLTFFTQATIESPHSSEAFQSLGYVYQSNNEPDKAVLLYNKSLKLNPDVINAHTNLGVILLNKGKFAEAEKEIIKEKVKGNEYTWLHLGRAYYGQDKKIEARFAWEQAYELDPNYLPVIINLALVNSDFGNYKLAKTYYLKAVAFGGYQSVDKIWLEKIKFLENK